MRAFAFLGAIAILLFLAAIPAGWIVWGLGFRDKGLPELTVASFFIEGGMLFILAATGYRASQEPECEEDEESSNGK